MRYLGIDFGLKHLGLAIADGPLAEPLSEKKYDQEIQALKFIVQLCQEQKIDQIILGLSENTMAETIKNFAAKLGQLIKLPINFQDETLTTKEAQAKLLVANAPQKKRIQDHRISAALILQDYLDTINQ